MNFITHFCLYSTNSARFSFLIHFSNLEFLSDTSETFLSLMGDSNCLLRCCCYSLKSGMFRIVTLNSPYGTLSVHFSTSAYRLLPECACCSCCETVILEIENWFYVSLSISIFFIAFVCLPRMC